MNIIGAGLTGCIAAYVFKDSTIHEYLEYPTVHKALLRFRSNDIAELTGIPFKQVNVTKGVIYDWEWVEPNIKMMNMYSMKVTGGVYDRSIGNLAPSVRWIAPENFHQQMLTKLDKRIKFGCGIDLLNVEKPVISTIPLPVLAEKIGLDLKIAKQKSSPIYVTTLHIDNCDVYQTAYVCDLATSVYRVSITENKMMIESTAPIEAHDITCATRAFHALGWHLIELNAEQSFGKFVPLENDLRKYLMYKITSQFDIYSLGRHATWRKILLDDVLHDAKQIESMMKTSAYDRMLGKMK